MEEFDLTAHPFLPLYGDSEIPLQNELYEKHKPLYSTDFRGGQPENKPYIMPFEIAEPRFLALIFPGGGYFACSNGAAVKIAEALNSRGATAFVLNYRVGDNEDPERGYNCRAILQDGVRAVQFVRNYADEHGLSDRKVIVFGFSAGGHLAVSLTLGAKEFDTLSDPVSRLDHIPDALVLGYPCTTLLEGAYPLLPMIFPAHEPENERARLLDEYSAPFHASSRKTPAFIWYGTDDRAVPPEFNAIPYAEALKKSGAECELVSYEGVGHGVGLALGTAAEGWLDRADEWLSAKVL